MGILDGKVVLITGAASGIGRPTALEAHREGARLLLSDVDADGGSALCAEIGADAIFSTCNVTDEEAVESLVAQAVRQDVRGLARDEGRHNEREDHPSG